MLKNYLSFNWKPKSSVQKLPSEVGNAKMWHKFHLQHFSKKKGLIFMNKNVHFLGHCQVQFHSCHLVTLLSLVTPITFYFWNLCTFFWRFIMIVYCDVNIFFFITWFIILGVWVTARKHGTSLQVTNMVYSPVW